MPSAMLREKLLPSDAPADESSSGSDRPRGIGKFASFVICYNTLLGPGVVSIPATFQRAGWLPSIAAFVFVCVVSTFAVTLLCDVMVRIPFYCDPRTPTREEREERQEREATLAMSFTPGTRERGSSVHASGSTARREYSDLFGYLFGPRTFLLTQWLFACCCFSQVVTGIVATAQVTDELLLFLFKRTYAVQLTPTPTVIGFNEEQCIGLSVCVPFAFGGDGDGDDGTDKNRYFLLTFGYVVAAACLAPLGYWTLDDNAQVQIISFWIQVLLLGKFAYTFLAEGLGHFALQAVGSDYTNVLGVAVFNFPLCMMIPTWMNERRKTVSVNGTIWSSMLSAVATYICLGLLGGSALPQAADDMLDNMGDASHGILARLASFAFGIVIVGLGVPVQSVVMRNNLSDSTGGGVLSYSHAAFVSCALPWLVGWTLYQGHLAVDVVAWAGTLFNGAVNLVLPLVLALAAANGLPACCRRGGRPELSGPSSSSVRPLPDCLEPVRAHFTWLLLLLVAPAMAVGIYALTCHHC